jgi:hypothetical protein
MKTTDHYLCNDVLKAPPDSTDCADLPVLRDLAEF